jgi:hypothetical protein
MSGSRTPRGMPAASRSARMRTRVGRPRRQVPTPARGPRPTGPRGRLQPADAGLVDQLLAGQRRAVHRPGQHEHRRVDVVETTVGADHPEAQFGRRQRVEVVLVDVAAQGIPGGAQLVRPAAAGHVGADAHQPGHPVGVGDGGVDRDRTAHRAAGDRDPVDAERVEERDRSSWLRTGSPAASRERPYPRRSGRITR